MKVFRVHLQDGKDFAVIAERFEVYPPGKKIKFFKSQDEEDKDIHVFLGNVIAVVPAVDLSGDKPRRILSA